MRIWLAAAVLIATACSKKKDCDAWKDLELHDVSWCSADRVEGESAQGFPDLLGALEKRGWTRVYIAQDPLKPTTDRALFLRANGKRVELEKLNFGKISALDRSTDTQPTMTKADAEAALRIVGETPTALSELQKTLAPVAAAVKKAPTKISDQALDAVDAGGKERKTLFVVDLAGLAKPGGGLDNIVDWFPGSLPAQDDRLDSLVAASKQLARVRSARLAIVALDVKHEEQRTSKPGDVGNNLSIAMILAPHIFEATFALVDLKTGTVLARSTVSSRREENGMSDDPQTRARFEAAVYADVDQAVKRMNSSLAVAR